MNYIFLRHAQAEHNAAQLIVGDSAYNDPAFQDAVLTETGHAQAATAAAQISGPVICYTSPLTRCIQTALAVNQKIPFTSFTATDALIECQGGGHICNRRRSPVELQATYLTLDCSALGDAPEEPTERESYEVIRRRVIPWLRRLQQLQYNSECTILIVTHYEVLFGLFGLPVKNAETIIMTADDLDEYLTRASQPAPYAAPA